MLHRLRLLYAQWAQVVSYCAQRVGSVVCPERRRPMRTESACSDVAFIIREKLHNGRSGSSVQWAGDGRSDGLLCNGERRFSLFAGCLVA